MRNGKWYVFVKVLLELNGTEIGNISPDLLSHDKDLVKVDPNLTELPM